MAKKVSSELIVQNDSSSILLDSPVDEGITASEGQIVSETTPGEKKKGVWKGSLSNRYVHTGKAAVKPSELLKAFRKVYRGNLSVKDMNNPSIQTIQQLKLEDNAKFLTEFRTLTKEHQERVVRKQEQVAKTAEAAATVSRDKSTDDLLIVIDELLTECVSASKA